MSLELLEVSAAFTAKLALTSFWPDEKITLARPQQSPNVPVFTTRIATKNVFTVRV
jgi:hypothetical protein